MATAAPGVGVCARNRRPATPAVFLGLFRCMPAGALEARLHWRGRRFAADCLPCESLRQRYPDGTARGIGIAGCPDRNFRCDQREEVIGN